VVIDDPTAPVSANPSKSTLLATLSFFSEDVIGMDDLDISVGALEEADEDYNISFQ
jgi:hypothetical protein